MFFKSNLVLNFQVLCQEVNKKKTNKNQKFVMF